MCELPREKNQRNFGSNNSVCVCQYNIMSTAGVKKHFIFMRISCRWLIELNTVIFRIYLLNFIIF